MTIEFDDCHPYSENKTEIKEKYRRWKNENFPKGAKFINPSFRTINEVSDDGRVTQSIIFEYDGIK